MFHKIDLTKDEASEEMAKILEENDVKTFFHGAFYSAPNRGNNSELEAIGTFHVLNALAMAGTVTTLGYARGGTHMIAHACHQILVQDGCKFFMRGWPRFMLVAGE